MPIDKELNLILKEMWRLDEKRKANESFTSEENSFYEHNINTIVVYYESNARYWSVKSGKPLKF